jgi:hypothetical protein
MNLDRLEKAFKDFIDSNPSATKRALVRVARGEELEEGLNAVLQKASRIAEQQEAWTLLCRFKTDPP